MIVGIQVDKRHLINMAGSEFFFFFTLSWFVLVLFCGEGSMVSLVLHLAFEYTCNICA